jgi:hypothetical protein
MSKSRIIIPITTHQEIIVSLPLRKEGFIMGEVAIDISIRGCSIAMLDKG